MIEHNEQRRIASKIVEMFMISLQSIESFDNKILDKSNSKIYYQYINVLTDAVEKIIILEWPFFDDEDKFFSGG